ncbi:hypothetical protein Tco_1115062 [Tanacetum coccineum]
MVSIGDSSSKVIDYNYTYAVSNPNGGNLALQFVESDESDIERVIFEFWFFNQALKTAEVVLPTSYEAFESSIKETFAKPVRLKTALLRPVSRAGGIGNIAIAMGMVKSIRLETAFAMLVGAYYVLSDLCEINKVAGDASNSEESSIEEYREIDGNIDCTKIMKGRLLNITHYDINAKEYETLTNYPAAKRGHPSSYITISRHWSDVGSGIGPCVGPGASWSWYCCEAAEPGGKLEGVDRLGCTMEPLLEPTLSVNRAESIGLKGLK